jgi:hypothetical protein
MANANNSIVGKLKASFRKPFWFLACYPQPLLEVLMRSLILVVCLLIGVDASAEVVWQGDFENGDLSDWNYLVNPVIDGKSYTNVVQDIVYEGGNAVRIELHDDAKWSNGLRRVELQHAPVDARTAEGAETYFAWSIYLPETISNNPTQQIGYWESKTSYRQMMAFTLAGDTLSFTTRQPSNVVQWTGTGVVAPAEWHRIAMRVKWSKDEAIGSVSVWFDGEQVVDNASAKTLNDDNAHFTQIGLLRGDADFTDVPVIYIDDAVEGDSLDDVRPNLIVDTPVMEPEATDMGTDVAPDDMGTSEDMSATADDAGSTLSDIGSETDQGTSPNQIEARGDSGCSQTGGSAPLSALLLVFGLVFFRRFRR